MVALKSAINCVQARQPLRFCSACCVEQQFVICLFCHTEHTQLMFFQTCSCLVSIAISCLLPCAWHAQMCMMQDFVLNNARHTAFEAQHLHRSLIAVSFVGYMVEKPSTVDEAIAYVWAVPDTVIGLADKQSLAAALAEKTDAVARRYFSAPNPELWVGTLRELLKSTGTFSQTQFDSGCNFRCCVCYWIPCLRFECEVGEGTHYCCCAYPVSTHDCISLSKVRFLASSALSRLPAPALPPRCSKPHLICC